MLQLDPAILTELRKRLNTLYNPRDIYLFGSYAKGTATIESDVDILVVMQPGVEAGRARVAEARKAIKDIFYQRDLPFDLLMKTAEDYERFKDCPGSIQNEVAMYGIPIGKE
jgi:predicted nucleotidyltransferase